MIVMNLYADNFYSFSDFTINFAYPKKTVNSTIDNEFLTERPNFRYKKVNILMGANASGKTTFGRLLISVCNFILNGNTSLLGKSICNREKQAILSMDFILDGLVLYRLDLEVSPAEDKQDEEVVISACVRSVDIAKADDYEDCVEKLERIPLVFNKTYGEECKKIRFKSFGWYFTFPVSGKSLDFYGGRSEVYLKVLENVLRTLDPSIRKVERVEGVEDSYIIWMKDMKLLMQKGKLALDDVLSSGTASGIEVAALIANMMESDRPDCLYFCDEKFSFINTDVEQAIISLMIDVLSDNAQLFITTHNSDVLDMNLPKHSFTFLRKDSDGIISAISASEYIKKNSDSVKNAVFNDVFSTVPRLDLINELISLKEGDK